MIEQTNPQLGAKSVNPLYVEKTLEKLAKTQEQHEKNLEDITKIPDLAKRVEALETIIKDLTKTQADIQEQVNRLYDVKEKPQEKPQGASRDTSKGPELKIRLPYLKPNKIDTAQESS